MNKILKWSLIGVVSVIVLVIFVGMYKFNYLAGKDGYDVDGNMEQNEEMVEESFKNDVVQIKKSWQLIRDDEGMVQADILYSKDIGKRNVVEDTREYQHGVDFLQKSDGEYILVWSSGGNGLRPLGARADGEWIHDVYYSDIDSNKPVVNPVKIIKAPLAQEPASSAINNDGHVMITMEDAWQAKNTLAQTYGVYDENMEAIKSYQQIVFDGGHSGHVAAVGNKFVVVYSDEWVEGGGVDNLGSGDDVLLSVYDTNGDFINKKDVAVGNQTRDWWPLVAGSEENVLLLWQRFVNGEIHANLVFSMYNPHSNEYIKENIILKEEIKYYTYTVEYLEDIDKFLVLGTSIDGKGFGVLISAQGEVISENYDMPAIVREAQPAIKSFEEGSVQIVYPASSDKLGVVSITATDIKAEGEVIVDYIWETAGTDGIFLKDNSVYFVSLSPVELKELRVKIYEELNSY